MNPARSFMSHDTHHPGTLETRIEDGIATIRFGHPKGNSLPGSLLDRMAAAVREAGGDPKVRVIVLASLGERSFCAGASFDELSTIGTPSDGKRFFMGFAKVIDAMRSNPKPVIARIQGKAVGGGVGLAAAADLTFATQGASVKLSELAVGIGPFVIGPAIERRIGTAAYGTLALDARSWYSAQWASERGLYSNVFGSIEELDAAIDRTAADLAASNPDALSALKAILWKDTDHWPSLMEERADLSGRLVLSDHTKRFIAQFGEGQGR
jgi:methylglutaconyl-CoA hydratase